MKQYGVRPFVRLSVPARANTSKIAAAGLLLGARLTGDISIDCCSSGVRQCEQCHVVSIRRLLNTDLLIVMPPLSGDLSFISGAPAITVAAFWRPWLSTWDTAYFCDFVRTLNCLWLTLDAATDVIYTIFVVVFEATYMDDVLHIIAISQCNAAFHGNTVISTVTNQPAFRTAFNASFISSQLRASWRVLKS